MTPVPDIHDEKERARLDADLLTFRRSVALERRSLFLRHLRLHISCATPLLTSVSSTTGLDLHGLAINIRPPRGWPGRPLLHDARASSAGIQRRFSFEPGSIVRRHLGAGLIVKSCSQSDDVIGIRVVGTSIELTLVQGDIKLDTFHGFGRLRLTHELPATLSVALPGRPVSQLVDHAWLNGRNWPIVDAIDDRGATVVTFATGQEAWRAPAATLLGDGGAGGC